MKVVILAGGYGTRMSEYTDTIPKPMVSIGNKPILWHIMNTYEKYGHNEFFIALGYKAEIVKQYFLNFPTLNSDFSVNLKDGSTTQLNNSSKNWDVTLIDTGLDTMTGGRIKRLKNHLNNEPFLLTYGDGLADVDLDQLMEFHKSHGKMVTMTAVRPSARFGELDITDEGKVSSFQEKPQLQQGWINGGYFVIQPEFLDLIEGDHIMMEREPLEKANSMGQLMACKHNGFWQCMDTKRDHEMLESLWNENKAPWKT